MKQEEEPWIDHLKQRVNEYEKPLPENDWNHFQTKYFTPYLHKKKRIRTMRIAAVLLLLFIPFATTFYSLQTEKHKVASPVVSLPAHQPRSITGNPSIMPENKLLPDRPQSKTTSLTKPPIQTSINTDTANNIGIECTLPAQDTIRNTESVHKSPSGHNHFALPHKRSEYTLALAISAGNNGTSTGFINKTFSRGDIGSSHKDEIMYWNDFKNYLQEYPSDFPDAQAYGALLQIANDNTGRPMTEYTHYNLPVSFALSFRKSISRHWGVSAGLQYTYLSSESSIGEDSKWVKRQKFHYIGLSVKLDRRLYTTRTFSFYTTGGGTIDKSVSGKLEQDFIVQKEKIYSSTESLKIKPLQFSIHAALGIQYNINPTLGAFIEPGAAFYFKDGSFKNTIRDEYPFHFNLQLGVRWNY